jgi:hypothetical protein
VKAAHIGDRADPGFLGPEAHSIWKHYLRKRTHNYEHKIAGSISFLE